MHMHGATTITDLQLQVINATDPFELLRLTQDFCRSDCVTIAFPACSSLDPQAAAGVDQINEGDFIQFNHEFS